MYIILPRWFIRVIFLWQVWMTSKSDRIILTSTFSIMSNFIETYINIRILRTASSWKSLFPRLYVFHFPSRPGNWRLVKWHQLSQSDGSSDLWLDLNMSKQANTRETFHTMPRSDIPVDSINESINNKMAALNFNITF